MPNRARDWLSRATRDLEQAEDSRRSGRHEWACFAVQLHILHPSHHPNSHPEGAPFEHYGPLQSDEAIRYAHEIIELTRSQMA
jgi:HEPN domain-containing protein